ncbi:MAG: sigma-70 family RNA polymerase sigma factor [Planctomycetota bacterium]|nr:sigma-70 family RNA polymerase sigma factor [Planctomycetota bacterium]
MLVRRRASAGTARETGQEARQAEKAAQNEAKLWRAYHRARQRHAAENAGPSALPRASRGALSVSAARCDSTRNALVEHYQPLVRTIASALERRLPRSVDRGDLETAGNVGLMSAIEAYDPERGVPFELYAEHRLRGALLDELRNLDWLPRPWRARLEARRRAIERLRADLGREPWDEEVAVALSVPLHVYQQDYGPALVESPVTPAWGEDGNSASGQTLEAVPDEGREAPEERLTRDDLLRLVAQRLTVLEYRLVYLKYWEDMPLREIGTVLGLSESRVCKIHMALLDRLRCRLGSGL